MIDWSAVQGVTAIVQSVHQIFGNTLTNRRKDSTTSSETLIGQQVDNEESVERYQVLLGRRHKFLREEILLLNPRQMSDFYGFEKVAYLEDYENGLDEFPTESIKRLVQVFFIRPEYLQESREPIFTSFDIISKREDSIRLLEQEFKPYFLCSPNFDKDGEAYLVFHKEDDGYSRMIKSNTVGGFYSSGGGANNVHTLILTMLNLDLNPDKLYIPFLNVKLDEWKKLETGCWYNKNMGGYVGAANNTARDIFEKWFKDQYKFEKDLNNY